jgi:uncharacterized protein YegP (UPF0339 family)
MPKPTKSLRFEYWKSAKNKQWYWRIRAGNGEPIAQGEGYKSKAGALKLFRLLLSLPLVAVDINVDKRLRKKTNEAIAELMADSKPSKKPKNFQGHINRNWP